MPLTFTHAPKNTPQTQQDIAAVITSAYWHDFSPLSKNPADVQNALAGSFNTEYFTVGYQGGTPVATAACVPQNCRAVTLNSAAMRRHLGLFIGFFSSIGMKKTFEAPPPCPNGDTGYIEFVGVVSACQGQGIARALMDALIQNAPYPRLVLEVGDTNTPARRLYQALGFTPYDAKKDPSPKISGFTQRLYLELEKG